MKVAVWAHLILGRCLECGENLEGNGMSDPLFHPYRQKWWWSDRRAEVQCPYAGKYYANPMVFEVPEVPGLGEED